MVVETRTTTWHRLVVKAGWPRKDYEAWLIGAFRREIARVAHPGKENDSLASSAI
jgi:hypothetical protein